MAAINNTPPSNFNNSVFDFHQLPIKVVRKIGNLLETKDYFNLHAINKRCQGYVTNPNFNDSIFDTSQFPIKVVNKIGKFLETNNLFNVSATNKKFQKGLSAERESFFHIKINENIQTLKFDKWDVQLATIPGKSMHNHGDKLFMSLVDSRFQVLDLKTQVIESPLRFTPPQNKSTIMNWLIHGDRLLTHSMNNTLTVWSLKRNYKKIGQLTAFPEKIHKLLIHGDTLFVLPHNNDGKIFVWQLMNIYQKFSQLKKNSKRPIFKMQNYPSISVTNDQEKIIDAQTYKDTLLIAVNEKILFLNLKENYQVMKSLPLPEGQMTRMQIYKDELFIFLNSGAIKIVSLENDKQDIADMQGQPTTVCLTHFSEDKLFTYFPSKYNFNFFVWDLKNRQILVQEKEPRMLLNMQFYAGRLFLTYMQNNKLEFKDYTPLNMY